MRNSKWLELAHEKRGHLYPPAIYWLTAQHACKEMGVREGVAATWHVNHEFSYLVTPGAFSQAGKVILRKFEHDQQFLKKIVQKNEKHIPRMLEAAKKLSGDLHEVSGEELFNRWNQWWKEFMELMKWSVMGTVMEMEEPLLTNKLQGLLESRLGNDSQEKGKYFQILTTATKRTIAGQEEIDLLQLRNKQLTSGITDQTIVRHLERYSWIAFGYDGPGWKVSDIHKRLDQLPIELAQIKKLIEEKEEVELVTVAQQKEIEKRLHLTSDEKRLFNVLRTLGFWKFERKFMNQQAHELMEDFIRELAKRYSLSIPQVKMIAPYEMEQLLIRHEVDPLVLNERIRESVVLFRGTDYKVLSGNNVKNISQQIRNSLIVDTTVSRLQGNTAYPGYAKGKVKRVDGPEDMKKLKTGEILISMSTSPHILPAMKRAAAIVTDSGGITSHAAIIAREIKIPTVIGTKIASKVLKDGDIVEVDANKGIVRKL